MLFGHQNDDKQQSAPVVNDVSAPDDQNTNPLAVDPDTGVSLPVVPEDLEHDGSAHAAVEQPDDTPAVAPQTFQPSDDSSAVTDDTTATTASDDAVVAPSSTTRDDLLQASGDDDLLNLKQQALQQLTPLVGHLDQTPEEKFRTTMMMIQSSDNQALIKDAYEAAQAITDDKARAQALLDIVNEINYFTQQQS